MPKLVQVIGVDPSGSLVTVGDDGKVQGCPSGQVILSGHIAAGQIAKSDLASKHNMDSGVATITANPTIFRSDANKILDAAWRGLREGRSAEDRMWVVGQIEAFHDLKVIDEFDYKGWLLKIETCPGHEDEGGWEVCAYCGINPVILP